MDDMSSLDDLFNKVLLITKTSQLQIDQLSQQMAQLKEDLAASKGGHHAGGMLARVHSFLTRFRRSAPALEGALPLPEALIRFDSLLSSSPFLRRHQQIRKMSHPRNWSTPPRRSS